MAFGEFVNKAKEAANTMKNVTSEKTNKFIEENTFLSDLKDIGVNKINETFNELNDSAALIKEAGYELSEIEVHIGVPLGITPHFILKDNISDEKKAQLLYDTKEKKIIHTILSVLFNISELQKKVGFKQFKFYEVEITLGVPPKINVRFLNTENINSIQSLVNMINP